MRLQNFNESKAYQFHASYKLKSPIQELKDNTNWNPLLLTWVQTVEKKYSWKEKYDVIINKVHIQHTLDQTVKEFSWASLQQVERQKAFKIHSERLIKTDRLLFVSCKNWS